jgi:hypothetical protein
MKAMTATAILALRSTHVGMASSQGGDFVAAFAGVTGKTRRARAMMQMFILKREAEAERCNNGLNLKSKLHVVSARRTRDSASKFISCVLVRSLHNHAFPHKTTCLTPRRRLLSSTFKVTIVSTFEPLFFFKRTLWRMQHFLIVLTVFKASG